MTLSLDFGPLKMASGEAFDHSRGKENEFSKKAFAKVAPKIESMKERILEMVSEAGASGITLQEAAQRLGKLPHQVSGRFSALKFEEKIEQSGERNGFGIWRKR